MGRAVVIYILASAKLVPAALYDLAIDPYETTDLTSNPAYSSSLSTLQSRLAYFAAQNGVADLQSSGWVRNY